MSDRITIRTVPGGLLHRAHILWSYVYIHPADAWRSAGRERMLPAVTRRFVLSNNNTLALWFHAERPDDKGPSTTDVPVRCTMFVCRNIVRNMPYRLADVTWRSGARCRFMVADYLPWTHEDIRRGTPPPPAVAAQGEGE